VHIPTNDRIHIILDEKARLTRDAIIIQEMVIYTQKDPSKYKTAGIKQNGWELTVMLLANSTLTCTK
jgi:hypothetical protein